MSPILRCVPLLLPVLFGCGDKDTEGNGDDTGELIDADGDGWGQAQDCNDIDALVNPDADEICDNVDNNCDGEIDEGTAIDALGFFADADGDGYGDPDAPISACAQPEGAVENADDCNDARATVYPGADEFCDGLDDDCDEIIDEDGVDGTPWYEDSDGDTYGNPQISEEACNAPAGHVDNDGDCNDADPDISPDATEICNGIDDDCEPSSSESGLVSWDDGSGLIDFTEAAAGTSSTPAELGLNDPGTLRFCEGRHYVNIDITADVDIVGMTGAADGVVLDGGYQGTVIDVNNDGLTVSIADLTATRGVGDNYGFFGGSYRGAGAISCLAINETVLSLSNVIASDSAGTMGGGISVQACTTTMDGVVSTDNEATWGAGVFVNGGTVEIYRSWIENNTGKTIAGGVYAFRYNGNGSDIYLEDTLLDANVSDTEGGGAMRIYYSDVECVGSTGTYGFTNNSAGDGVGGILCEDTTSTFVSSGCDFGDGSDDNTGDDIVWNGVSYELANDSTVSCDSSGCSY